MDEPDSPPAGGLHRRHLPLLLPFLWQVGGVPWANGVAWRPWHMPFLLLWELAGVVVASLAIALVYRLDAAAAAR
jgi:hypothetical protein